MAKLTPCRECGHQVSRMADKCPSCGVKNPFKADHIFRRFLLVLVLGVIVAGVAFQPDRSPISPEEKIQADARQIQAYAQTISEEKVRARLKAPSTAEFSGPSDTVVEPAPGGTRKIPSVATCGADT